MTKKILIVEDDRRIAELVRAALVREGFTAEVVADGNEALVAFRVASPDLIILDRGLPGMDGMNVLREVRQSDHTPVLVLTARDQEDDTVHAFELGADDYVTKPFSMRELMVRIKSLFRRSPVQQMTPTVQFDRLEIRVAERLVLIDGKQLETTRTEFDVLLLLASNPGVVFSRERLLHEVWGYSFEGYERSVDTQVTRLRKKIEEDPKDPKFIETVWGVGYKFRNAQG
ncbi:MAG: response regulator transcription factor [Candidatus Riflebacteria bacterium]|nr:response regulator transcription factor [Candidatus Riflebacteria bacterium]